MQANRKWPATAHAIEAAVLCACELGDRDIAARLFKIGRHFDATAAPRSFPAGNELNTYNIIRVSKLRWGVEWDANGTPRGLLFSSLKSEPEAVLACMALERLECVEQEIADQPA